MAFADEILNLFAWIDTMPGKPRTLHVTGVMRIRNQNDSVTLEPISPQPESPTLMQFRVVISNQPITLPAIGAYEFKATKSPAPIVHDVELVCSDASKKRVPVIIVS